MHHHIHTSLWTVIRQWPYCILKTCCQAIEAEVAQILHNRVIEESASPWSSPIIVVPKLDGSLSLCKDFQKFNEVSEFDGYTMQSGMS